jgi:SAM-dependent MidA family methyltransferase
MNELHTLIRDEIVRLGSMRFDRFMELALYHPTHGYYRRERERPRTGRQGDFFTSVSVGPLFGRLLGRQFLEMWERLGKPEAFRIIEQGAEDAQLACDILSWWRDAAPDFFAAMRYVVIEEAATAQGRQEKRLEAQGLTGKADWLRSVGALAEKNPVGVFFSNELADAFPVRRVICRNGTWRELQVTLGEGEAFAWTERPIEDRELAGEIAALPLPVVEGYTTEIHLQARDWMEEVARAMKRGYVLTVDYGFPASAYYAPFRANGTLTAYREHRRMEEVLAEPGGCDLTAHVDFTGLVRAGERNGLRPLGLLDQQHFLMGVAENELSGAEDTSAGIADQLRAWHTLTHPQYLGGRFQVLLQAKEAPGAVSGLRHARPGGLD